MKKKEAIILAGGFGTRLKSEVADLPKPMAPVNGKPFLEYLLQYLNSFGFNRVVLSTGYMAEKITSYFGDSYGKMKLVYAKENSPLGTGGALKYALEHCEEQHILVLNGDSFYDIDLQEFSLFHLHYSPMFSLATRSVEDASRYGTIETVNDEITAFKEKSGEARPGVINAGVYYVDNYFFCESAPEQESFSLEKDFFEKHVNDYAFMAYQAEGYFIDIGIPEDYKRAQDDFKGFKY